MITKSPYGFGYGRKAYRVGAEPEQVNDVCVRKPEPQAVIDHCLNCTRAVCSGNCEFTPEGKSYSKYKMKQNLKKKRSEELDQEETEKAAQVADMYRIGWC